jgi:hypothetical protein
MIFLFHFPPSMAIFREVINKRKSSVIFVLFLENVVETHSEFILGKNKLKLFCCVPNVQYKMPHGTQNRNGYPYPLSYMGHFCKGNRETKYFYLTEKEYFITHQLSADY